MQKIQKAFIWNNLSPKIKHEIPSNSFEEGGFKNVDINSKIASLQYSLDDYMMTSFMNGN